MKRYWISWNQHSSDYRPLTDPPSKTVLGWWCSGRSGDDEYSTLCAVVQADSEDAAQEVVRLNWELDKGDVGAFRFVEEKPADFVPTDRFPITKDWVQERFAKQ